MAKAKALPKGVIGYVEFFNKLSKQPGSLGLVLIYGQEQYLIDGALKMAKQTYVTEGAESIDFNIIDTRSDDLFSFDRLDEMVSMPPMMSDRRLVIIRQSGIMGKEVSDKDGGEISYDSSTRKQTFLTDPTKVHEIHIGTFEFPTCSYRLQEPQVKAFINVNVRGSDVNKNIYTRTLRIDCIKMVPRFED